jgi:hypothetical protein
MEDLIDLTLADLAQQCAQETHNFRRGKVDRNSHYCYELLRRAFMERSDQSWALIYEQYHAQVRSWIRRHPAYASCRTDEDSLINIVFDRLWSALSPEKFARLKDMGSVMRYMQTCIHSVLIDHLRAEVPETYVDRDDDESLDQLIAPDGSAKRVVEQHVLDEISQSELWALVQHHMKDKRERLVMIASFTWDLAPREIYGNFPETFESVDQIYRIKENILARLRRDEGLRTFLELSS